MIEKLARHISIAGGKLYIVGGAIRDGEMGIEPEDIDLVIVGMEVDDALPILEAHSTMPVDRVVSDAPVWMIKMGDEVMEVAFARKDIQKGIGKKGFAFETGKHITLFDDLFRRHTTISAMAQDVLTGEEFDFFGGKDDIKRKIMRPVSKHFVESPDRVIIVAAHLARFPEFEPTDELIEMCKSMKKDFHTISVDQLRKLFFKAFKKAKKPSRFIEFLIKAEWVEFFPEIEAMIGCEQEPEWHPEGDVITHTMIAMDKAAEIADREGLDRVEMIFAALCHDMGKPDTTIVEGGKIKSPGHAEHIEPVKSFCKRVGMPVKMTKKVVGLTKFHMRHITITSAGKRIVRRISRDSEGAFTFHELACIVEADHSARPPLKGGCPQVMLDMIEIAEELEMIVEFKPILMGRHLIEMGMKPGPKFGIILRAAAEAQVEGEFETVEEAIEWARSTI